MAGSITVDRIPDYYHLEGPRSFYTTGTSASTFAGPALRIDETMGASTPRVSAELPASDETLVFVTGDQLEELREACEALRKSHDTVRPLRTDDDEHDEEFREFLATSRRFQDALRELVATV